MTRDPLHRTQSANLRRHSLGAELLEQRAMLSAHTITVVDFLDLLPASVESEIVRTGSYGMNLISQYVEWKGTLNTEVRIRPASENPNSAANGLMPSIVSATWTGSAWSNDTLNEMISGVDPKPTEADVGMTIYLGSDGQIRNYDFLAWFDPQPSFFVPPKVPTGSFDFIGVFVHEVFHGIGFLGWSKEFQNLTTTSGGVDYFVGKATQQVYGGPLPLSGIGEDHYGNTSLPGNTLQSGLMFQWGNYAANRLDIGKLDLAVLQDLGLTVKSTVGLPLVDVLDSQRPAAALSSNAVNENVGSGTTVATLTTQGGPVTTGGSFSLVAGFGDNSAFRISENRLLTDSLLDYEQKITHSLLIRFADKYGVFTDTPLTVSVRDMTEAAPPNIVGTPGNGQVGLAWSAPVSNGGSPITDYIVQYRASTASDWITFPDGISTATSATVTGLTNGTPYVFRVSAVSEAGTGEFSTPSAPVTPITVPTAPRNLAATPGDRQVTLTWSAPASDGGAAITDYVVQFKTARGGWWRTFADGTSTTTSATVTGLTNGTSYVFRVAAVNSSSARIGSAFTTSILPVGQGMFSATSAAVTPRTVPGAPRSVRVAVRSNVRLYWQLPVTNGGAPITHYVVQFKPAVGTEWTTFADRVLPVSPSRGVAVSGLAAGVSYVFRVAAVNSAGIGEYCVTLRAVRLRAGGTRAILLR
jgi:hypothetical protein